MKLFAAIPLVIAWIPHVMKAVAMFEAVLDPKLSGPEKKARVLAYLSELSDKLNLPWGDTAIEVVSDLIDSAVGIYKWIGAFRSKEDMTPAEVEGASAAAAAYNDTAKANVEKVASQDVALSAFLDRMNN